jgi:hypothetical protein
VLSGGTKNKQNPPFLLLSLQLAHCVRTKFTHCCNLPVPNAFVTSTLLSMSLPCLQEGSPTARMDLQPTSNSPYTDAPAPTCPQPIPVPSGITFRPHANSHASAPVPPPEHFGSAPSGSGSRGSCRRSPWPGLANLPRPSPFLNAAREVDIRAVHLNAAAAAPQSLPPPLTLGPPTPVALPRPWPLTTAVSVSSAFTNVDASSSFDLMCQTASSDWWEGALEHAWGSGALPRNAAAGGSPAAAAANLRHCSSLGSMDTQLSGTMGPVDDGAGPPHSSSSSRLFSPHGSSSGRRSPRVGLSLLNPSRSGSRELQASELSPRVGLSLLNPSRSGSRELQASEPSDEYSLQVPG